MEIIVSVQPVTVDKPAAAAMLGIGETMLMQLVNDGELNARKLRTRTVFAVEDLKNFAANLPGWEPRR
jgi:hypothetical protein